MGIFKKLKKVFKKVTGFVKKHIKKTIKAVKKVSKKIRSSKILKALAIAAAIVVTGGAALTAFGGTGALATSKLGVFMMNTSTKVLGGTLFTGATTTLGQAAQATGNFLTKTIAKPFGAVGGALGSTARVGANILTGQSAFAPGAAAGAPAPFSSAALSGQLDTSQITYDPVNEGYLNNQTGMPLTADEVARLPDSFTSTINKQGGYLDSDNNIVNTTSSTSTNNLGGRAAKFATGVAGDVVTGLAVGYANQAAFGGDATGGYGSNLRTEGPGNQDPLQIFAANKGIDVGSIYNNMSYGTADPSFAAGANLYTQETMAVA